MVGIAAGGRISVRRLRHIRFASIAVGIRCQGVTQPWKSVLTDSRRSFPQTANLVATLKNLRKQLLKCCEPEPDTMPRPTFSSASLDTLHEKQKLKLLADEIIEWVRYNIPKQCNVSWTLRLRTCLPSGQQPLGVRG